MSDNIELSSFTSSDNKSEYELSSWGSDSDADAPESAGPPQDHYRAVVNNTLGSVVQQHCPCIGDNCCDHFGPFRESALFSKLVDLKCDLARMAPTERRITQFNLVRAGSIIFGHNVCSRGFVKVLGIHPKTVSYLRSCKFAPGEDNRTIRGIRLSKQTPQSDVVHSFLTHAYTTYAEDVANVVGWGITDMRNIPQSKWKLVTDCVLNPFSELQVSDSSGPVAQACRRDSKLLPPMSTQDLHQP